MLISFKSQGIVCYDLKVLWRSNFKRVCKNIVGKTRPQKVISIPSKLVRFTLGGKNQRRIKPWQGLQQAWDPWLMESDFPLLIVKNFNHFWYMIIFIPYDCKSLVLHVSKFKISLATIHICKSFPGKTTHYRHEKFLRQSAFKSRFESWDWISFVMTHRGGVASCIIWTARVISLTSLAEIQKWSKKFFLEMIVSWWRTGHSRFFIILIWQLWELWREQ